MITRFNHANACGSSQVCCHKDKPCKQEKKQSGTLLRNHGYLLFPTEDLTVPVSLAGSADVVEYTSELSVSKKAAEELTKNITSMFHVKKSSSEADVKSIFDRVMGMTIDEFISVQEELSDTLEYNLKMYAKRKEQIAQEMGTPVKDVTLSASDETFMASLKRLLTSMLYLGQYLKSELDKGSKDFSTDNTIRGYVTVQPNISKKIDDMKEALLDTLTHDMSSLKDTIQTGGSLDTKTSAFLKNDSRYPDGSDLRQLQAFWDRKYRALCALPGSFIVDAIRTSTDIEDPTSVWFDFVDLDTATKANIKRYFDTWKKNQYQCNNCTEDEHSLIFVIQAVGHLDSANDQYDKVDPSRDIFFVGRECFISLVHDPEHFISDTASDEAETIIDSVNFDAVANSIQLTLLTQDLLFTLLEREGQVPDKISPIIGLEEEDGAAVVKYFGHSVEKVSNNKTFSESLVQPSVLCTIPVPPQVMKATKRHLEMMVNSLIQSHADLGIVMTTSAEAFSEALKTQVQARTIDISDAGELQAGEESTKELEILTTAKSGWKGLGRFQAAMLLNVLHEVFDYDPNFLFFQSKETPDLIYVVARDVNQEGYNKTSMTATGFTISIVPDGEGVLLRVKRIGETTMELWKDSFAEVEVGLMEKDSIAERISASVHIAFIRSKDALGKEIAELTGKDILNCFNTEVSQKSPRYKLIDGIKKLALSLSDAEIPLERDNDSLGNAVNMLRSISEGWQKFVVSAMRVAYDNLASLEEYTRLSSKSTTRHYVILSCIGLSVSGMSPSEYLRAQHPERYSDVTANFRMPKEKGSGLRGQSSLDVYFNTVMDVTGGQGLQDTSSGDTISSVSKFRDYLKNKGKMGIAQAQGEITAMVNAGWFILSPEQENQLATILMRASQVPSLESANAEAGKDAAVTLESRIPVGIKRRYIGG